MNMLIPENVMLRWSQLVPTQSGMRVSHGPLRVLQKARSFIFLAKTRVKWGR
jgi:hypothetical protein